MGALVDVAAAEFCWRNNSASLSALLDISGAISFCALCVMQSISAARFLASGKESFVLCMHVSAFPVEEGTSVSGSESEKWI